MKNLLSLEIGPSCPKFDGQNGTETDFLIADYLTITNGTYTNIYTVVDTKVLYDVHDIHSIWFGFYFLNIRQLKSKCSILPHLFL